MAQSTAVPAVAPVLEAGSPLPVRSVLPWALFVGTLMLIALYFVGAEQGATAVFSGEDVHEWVHDGRHILGFPCH
ncbi:MULTISPECIES: CbtB-domain containing protein [unclassified Streptomyces]|uniref:CbtB-domain containing protein n=1 Tax=Streptomyces sp. NBC_00060 TaxID=2975636 RepID=A0AAU2GTB1_9ACTN